MKRSLGLLFLGIVACETTPARVGPGTVANEPPGPAAPRDPILAPIIPPAEIVATETGNPPAATCGPGRYIQSADDCAAVGALLQAHYAAPRPIRYLQAGAPGSQDTEHLRVADDPYSISRCVAPSEHIWRQLDEPVCVCASAEDDLNPAALGRFGEASRLDAGPVIDSCGQQIGQGPERWTCLYQRDEFPGCDPTVADSCAGVCAEYRQRAIAQANSTFDVQVRRAHLAPNPIDPCRPGRCELIFEVGNQCFVGYVEDCYGSPPALGARSYDCSLTDEQILTQAGYTVVRADAGSSALQCNAQPPDAGAIPSGDAGTNSTSNDAGATPRDGGPIDTPADASSDAGP